MKRRVVVTGGLAAVFAALLRRGAAQAQSKYPDRPIRLVVPYPPGGVYDAVGRPWADRMNPLLGSVFVENMGGAGGGLGSAAVARAAPDGYTLLLGGPLVNLINSIAVSKPLFDPKDLTAVSMLAVSCFGITVHPSVAPTLRDLVAAAKADPGRLSYASAGVGSPNHLCGEMFRSFTGTEIVHVPYRGMGPALTDVVAGQVPIAMATVTGQVLDLHRSGKVRILAVTTPQRLTAEAGIPTAVEAGVAGMIAQQVLGVFAPGGTPGSIVDRIAQATQKLLSDPEFQGRLVASGFETPRDASPDRMQAVIAEEDARWTPIIKAIGLRLD